MNIRVDPLLSLLRANKPRSKFWFCIIDEPEQPIVVADIQAVVAGHFGLTTHDLTSACRTQREVLPRHIAMYLCRTLTKHSHEKISCWFNRSDHSASIYAFGKISKLLANNERIAGHVRKITARLQ
jgi:chromosomal replication initiator protein